MSTGNRRLALSSSSSSSSAKKPPITGNQSKKVGAVSKTQFTKKRVALSDVTNQGNGTQNGSRAMVTLSKPMVPCTSKVAKKKETSTLPKTPSFGSFDGVSRVDTIWTRDDHPTTNFSALPFPSSVYISPCRSLCASVSLDETMSICDSVESPKFEYLEDEDVSAIKSTETKANNNLYISEHAQKEDPQFCGPIARIIYKNSRASEAKSRPSTNFMEMVQKDINAGMRAILIDWLVEATVAVAWSCVHDIASKYEEISAPQVEQFCYVTDNTYGKDEILQMESSVLNYLKFEMTVPTANFFLRQFVLATEMINEVQSLQFECLANYIAELSLLEYTMVGYAPSLIAASAAFLARYILSPSKNPWDSMSRHYTLYQSSDLENCVKALHHLCRNGGLAKLPAIREKYSQHKYKFVAKKYCPASVPEEFFQDVSD